MPTPTDPAEWIRARRDVHAKASALGLSGDALFIGDARVSLPKALDALEAVLGLHSASEFKQDFADGDA